MGKDGLNFSHFMNKCCQTRMKNPGNQPQPRTVWRLFLVLILLSLAACQAAPDAPQVTKQSTSSAATPTTQRVTRTPAHTPTPAASLTPALPDYLAISPGDLKGVQIDFWHPWQGELAETAELLASEF